MNDSKLRQAEKKFLKSYPGGFQDPELEGLDKKFKMSSHIDFVQENFTKKSFSDPGEICSKLAQIMSRSAMISMFEKPKFKDYALSLTPREQKERLCRSFI